MHMRIRTKICGLTHPDDVDAAVQAGADAIGFVLYPPSPRFVTPEQAGILAQRLPSFVTPVLLFVKPSPDWVADGLRYVPHALLQFHGDEPTHDCLAYQRPYLKALRIPQSFQGEQATQCILTFCTSEHGSCGWLLDTWVDGFGGGGHTFDWSSIDWHAIGKHVDRRRLVLSGGLTPDNVQQGIRIVQPGGVDVSSGVECWDPIRQRRIKGRKDPELLRQFMQQTNLM